MTIRDAIEKTEAQMAKASRIRCGCPIKKPTVPDLVAGIQRHIGWKLTPEQVMRFR